jgi:hypothetical protein
VTFRAVRNSTLVATLEVTIRRRAGQTDAWNATVTVPLQPAAVEVVASRVRSLLVTAPWDGPLPDGSAQQD